MRLIVLAVLLTSATSVAAQQPPTVPAPPDYTVLTSLDLAGYFPDSNGRTTLALSGWVFECRSGLQPMIERNGQVGVAFQPVDGSPLFFASGRYAGGVPRADVLAAYGPACPSVGNHTGYWLWIDVVPPPGKYTVYVFWTTLDGAFRPANGVGTLKDVVVQ